MTPPTPARSDVAFHLPSHPPSLKLPADIWVPVEWRLLQDVAGLKQYTVRWLEQTADQAAASLPWVLLAHTSGSLPAPPDFFVRNLLGLNAADDIELATWCGTWGLPRVPRSLLVERRDPVIVADEALLLRPGSALNPCFEPSEFSDFNTDTPTPGTGGTSGCPFERRLPMHLRSVAFKARAHVHLDDLILRSSRSGFDLRPVQLRSARFAIGLRQAITRLFTSLPRPATFPALEQFDADALAEIWKPAGVSPKLLKTHPDALLDTLVTALELLNEMIADANAWTVSLIGGQGEELFERKANVGNLLAVELALFLSERAPLKRCARCDQFFVRQAGRAMHGQQRLSGVKYCSVNCANAAQSQAYRRRKAAEQAKT